MNTSKETTLQQLQEEARRKSELIVVNEEPMLAFKNGGNDLDTLITTAYIQGLERAKEILEKHHNAELIELFDSNNESVTKQKIERGLDVYKTQFDHILTAEITNIKEK